MAKFYCRYCVALRYTNNKILSFDFYKGFLGGYYITKLGTEVLDRHNCTFEELSREEEKIRSFVSFIETEDFDTLSKEEYKFIQSDNFETLCSLLRYGHYTFNHNFTSVKFCGYPIDDFSVNDEGRGYTVYTGNKTRWLYMSQKEYYVGTTELKKGATSIRIPVIDAEKREHTVEVIDVSTNVDIFRCLCFCMKINLLGSFLFRKEKLYWGSDCPLNTYLFSGFLDKFNFYRVI